MSLGHLLLRSASQVQRLIAMPGCHELLFLDHLLIARHFHLYAALLAGAHQFSPQKQLLLSRLERDHFLTFQEQPCCHLEEFLLSQILHQGRVLLHQDQQFHFQDEQIQL